MVYIAPPGSHLLIDRGSVQVERSPREGYFRPSINALFRSAATAYGRRVVGVQLSGLLADGAAGLWQIKKRGGIVIVQDPVEATCPSMPEAALRDVKVDYCLPAARIAEKLVELAMEPPSPPPPCRSRRPRILIVEDERIVAKDLEHRLTELNYEIAASVSSGEEALRAASETWPDVALMDIMLAGELKGTEAARLIWEQLQIPVVYLTAYADERTLNEAKRSMPLAYILKPWRPEQIHAALQIALERYDRELAASS